MNLKEHINVSTYFNNTKELFGFDANFSNLLNHVQLSFDNYKGLMSSITGFGMFKKIPPIDDAKNYIELGISDGKLSLKPTCVLNSKNTLSAQIQYE